MDLNDDLGVAELLVRWQLDGGRVYVVGADRIEPSGFATSQFKVSFALSPVAQHEVWLVEVNKGSADQAQCDGEEECCVGGVVIIFLILRVKAPVHPVLFGVWLRKIFNSLRSVSDCGRVALLLGSRDKPNVALNSSDQALQGGESVEPRN